MTFGWNTQKLGDVCELLKRGIAPKYIDSGGICVINQKCIRDHSINVELSRRHNIDIKSVNPERYIRRGDVLVNSTGTGTLGRVAQVREEPGETTTVDTHVTIVRPIFGMFHPEFFGYMLIKIEDEITSSGEGASGQTELARKTLESKFDVSFPLSIEEQKRIVSILDEAFKSIDQAIANTEKNLANARELFESYLNNVFTQKGEGWVDMKVEEFADTCLGKMLDKNKNKGNFKPYLRNLNIQWFHVNEADLLEMRFEEREFGRYTVMNGDLLICEGGYPGRAAIWGKDEIIFFQKALHRVRGKTQNHNYWLLYYLYISDITGILKNYYTGAGIQHFTGKSLKRFVVPIPPELEMDIHLRKFKQLHNETRKLESISQIKLLKLNELKQSLLQKAFAGQLS